MTIKQDYADTLFAKAPVTECNKTNRYLFRPCTICGKDLIRMKTKGFFWRCSNPMCKTTVPDVNGEPGTRKPTRPALKFHCRSCGKPLARLRGMTIPRRKGEKAEAYDFYRCIDFSVCNSTYKTGIDGEPVFSKDAT